MPTDSSKLPHGEWLTLFEAATLIAWEEVCPLGALRWRDYPSGRHYDAQIRSAFERCREEARGVERLSRFWRMVECYSRDPFHPPTSAVIRSIACRPDSARHLYRLLLKRERSEAKDEKKLAKAELRLQQALLSWAVKFTGIRDGTREKIDLTLCDASPAIDAAEAKVRSLYSGTVQPIPVKLLSPAQAAANPIDLLTPSADQKRVTATALPNDLTDTPDAVASRITVGFGRSIEWTDVSVEQASLVAWLKGTANSAPTEELPTREKKKAGAKPDYDWQAIEEAARLIAARPKVPGIEPATERLIAAIQKWHQTQHPTERFPGRSTLQRMLNKWGLS